MYLCSSETILGWRKQPRFCQGGLFRLFLENKSPTATLGCSAEGSQGDAVPGNPGCCL